MEKRRVGQFYLNADVLDRNIEAVMEVMGRCAIVRCEHLYLRKAFEYVAICPDFDEVSAGEEMPKYQVVIHGGGSVEFKRLK